MELATADQEIIFESWLLKYRGNSAKQTIKFSRPWKKRYFVLMRDGNKAVLKYYERKLRSLQDTPKGTYPLSPEYQIYKRGSTRGQDYVCEIVVNTERLWIAADDAKIYHLFTFFLQTQTKLREVLEGSCYVVRPDSSEEHRKLGSYGTMCLLHISKGGITLALQLSKCVLAQWPLSSIKYYESPEHGKFALEAGKNSPMGPGQYIFNTRLGQGHDIFDVLDNQINEVSDLRRMVDAISSHPGGAMEAMVEQWSVLQNSIVVETDSRFLPHLKKISRNIFDHLSQHLGGSIHQLGYGEGSVSNLLDGTPRMETAERRTSNKSSNSRAPSEARSPEVTTVPMTPTTSSVSPSTSAAAHGNDWSTPSSGKKPRALHKSPPVEIPTGRPSPHQQKPPSGAQGYLLAGPQGSIARIKPKKSQSTPDATHAPRHNSANSSQEGRVSETLADSPKHGSHYLPMGSPEVSLNTSRVSAGSVKSLGGADRYVLAKGMPNIMIPRTIEADSPSENRNNACLANSPIAYENITSPTQSQHVASSNVKKGVPRTRNLSKSFDSLDAYIAMDTSQEQASGGIVNVNFCISDEFQSPTYQDSKDEIYSYASPDMIHRGPSQRQIQRRQGPNSSGAHGVPDRRKSRSANDLLGQVQSESSKTNNTNNNSGSYSVVRADSPSQDFYEMMKLTTKDDGKNDETENTGNMYVSDSEVRKMKRLSSRSCEDLTQYSRISANTMLYSDLTDDVFGSPPKEEKTVTNDEYSYAKPTPCVRDESIGAYTKVHTFDDPNNIFRNNMSNGLAPPNVEDLYSRPISKALRKSMSNPMMDADEADGTSNGARAKKPQEKSGRPAVANKPPKFDFGSLRRKKSSESPEKQSPLKLALHQQSLASPTTMQGVSLTDSSRVFSKKKGKDSGGTNSLTGSPVLEASAPNRTMDLLQNQNSLKNRRLPSLPADSSYGIDLKASWVPTDNGEVTAPAGTKETLC